MSDESEKESLDGSLLSLKTPYSLDSDTAKTDYDIWLEEDSDNFPRETELDRSISHSPMRVFNEIRETKDNVFATDEELGLLSPPLCSIDEERETKKRRKEIPATFSEKLEGKKKVCGDRIPDIPKCTPRPGKLPGEDSSGFMGQSRKRKSRAGRPSSMPLFEEMESVVRNNLKGEEDYVIAKISTYYPHENCSTVYGYKITEKQMDIFEFVVKHDILSLKPSRLKRFVIHNTLWENISKIGDKEVYFELFKQVFDHMITNGYIKDASEHLWVADCGVRRYQHYCPILIRHFVDALTLKWRTNRLVLICPVCRRSYKLVILKHTDDR